MKKLVLTLTVAAAITLAGFGRAVTPASATQPVGGCPDDFELVSLRRLARILDLTYEQVQAIPAVDNNGDGYTCFDESAGGVIHGTDNVR